MSAHVVELPVDDTTMGLYVAEPDGEARAAVIVLQEAFGVNDHIEDITRRFADAGYLAVAPHLFHRSGDPRLGYEDMTQVMPHMAQLTAHGLDADLTATLDYLAGRGLEQHKVGAVGFCMGGSVAFVAAAFWKLGAAVTFYGGGITQGRFGNAPLLDLAPTIQTPWLGLFGDLDASIPVEQVEGLRAALERAVPPTEIVRYAEANHGFHCDARSSYHAAASKDAWARTLGFLAQHLG